jgi:uncharacterized protein (DUF2236 family)
MSDLPTPERCQAIAYRLACYDFPWDVTRALELALFRTFASPSVAGVLHGTGEFEARPQRRYDDTDLIVSAMVEHGVDSDLGRRAIARMNAIHGRFRISNEDFLYVLSTFVFEPLRWLDRFGWRPLTEEERLGWCGFWFEVGKRMSIRDIPQDYAAFEQFNRDYESERFRRTPATVAVAAATRDMFASWFPGFTKPLVGAVIAGLLDEPLREAFAFPAANVITRLTRVAMKVRAIALRLLPKRRHPRLRTKMIHRSYPNGWRVEELGPPGPDTHGKRSAT